MPYEANQAIRLHQAMMIHANRGLTGAGYDVHVLVLAMP